MNEAIRAARMDQTASASDSAATERRIEIESQDCSTNRSISRSHRGLHRAASTNKQHTDSKRGWRPARTFEFVDPRHVLAGRPLQNQQQQGQLHAARRHELGGRTAGEEHGEACMQRSADRTGQSVNRFAVKGNSDEEQGSRRGNRREDVEDGGGLTGNEGLQGLFRHNPCKPEHTTCSSPGQRVQKDSQDSVYLICSEPSKFSMKKTPTHAVLHAQQSST